MKNLYDVLATNEGLLDDGFEKQFDDSLMNKWIDVHYDELFDSKYGKKAAWTKKGIDTGDADVNWKKVIEYWKQGVELKFAKIGNFQVWYDFGRDGFSSLPEDPADFDLLMNTILAKAKIKWVLLKNTDTITPQVLQLICHPGLESFTYELEKECKIMPGIDFGKIHAKEISISFPWDMENHRGWYTPTFNYEAISGWKGNILRVSHAAGLVDTEKWRTGQMRVLEINEKNKIALDYLFSKNQIKKRIQVKCMHLYDGNNRRCCGKPYDAWVERAGSDYKITLK